jgi:hypothetical protein
MKDRKSVKLLMPLHVAETLHGFIDGGIGTSEDDEFSKQMKPLIKKLEKEFDRIYTNRAKAIIISEKNQN